MKTTLNIDDTVMQRLKEEAARRQTTMSALVEAGLRLILETETAAERTQDLPPLPSWNAGPELVDIANRDELYAVLDEDDFNLTAWA
ncbi:MAG: hypothetical protein OXC56_04135 [Chloroflexi bacterium]|nr:hypothetical protein [Chloroflexota bacterium]